MDEHVKIVEMRPYKVIYYTFLSIMTAMTAASWLLVQNDIYLRGYLDNPNQSINIFLVALVAMALLYGYYLRNRRLKMASIVDFEEKIAFHRNYFKIKMWWSILTGASSCMLYLLTANKYFFWFVLFDFLSLLLAAPNKFFFKKELNDDDIIFV